MSDRCESTAAPEYDICIIGLKCWGQISCTDDLRFIGGIETDLATLARMLARSGQKVALVTYDEGQPKITDIDGITVYASFSESAGLPGLRFIFPRAIKLIRTIRNISARNFVQMGAGVETGWVGIACKWRRKSDVFIFLAGGDRDCMKKLPAISRLRERVLYRIGLLLADRVITQTQAQSDLMCRNFGRRSDVLRLPNQLGESSAQIAPNFQTEIPTTDGHTDRLRVLWVGRLDLNKRPDWLLTLAMKHREYRFDVVGDTNTPDNYSMEFIKSAQSLTNVHLHGKVSPKNIVRFYQAADLLCCTSEVEGFPAVFLEAWSFGVPTVSTVDPGGLISKFKVGVSVKSESELCEALNYDKVKRLHETWARNARQLYEREFSPAACLEKFNRALNVVTS